MRKILFVLCLVFSVSAISQTRSKSYTFNFSSYSWLGQYNITTENLVGASASITNKVFKSDDEKVSISFDKGNAQLGVRVQREDTSAGSHFLTIPRLASMIVTGNDVNITGFRIPGTDGAISGLTLEDTGTDPKVGSFGLSSSQQWYEWSSGTNEVSSLRFQYHSASVCSIHRIVVDYEAPRDALLPTSVSIANNSTITSFSSIALTFSNNMTATSDAQYSLSDGNNNYPLTSSVSGKVVTLSSATPITADGTYTLTVNAGSYADSDDFRNKQLVYTFNILRPFEISSISPAAGTVESIPTELILTFADNVASIDANKTIQITDANSVQKCTATAEISTTDATQVVLTTTSDVTDNGVFTLTIPEKTVYDVAGHYNEEVTFVYKIGDIASDELQAKAASFLAMTGIGYPKSNDEYRTALAALTANGSTAQYTSALAAYLTSTNVEMPVSNKYYYLKAVAKGGATRYIAYSNETVSTTTSAANAVPLLITGSNGTYSFKTPDGKYLLQLGSNSGVSATSSNLTLEKLSVTDANNENINEDVFGLFSLGSNSVYALANISSGALSTSDALTNFTATLTNGFTLETVPDAYIPVPDAAFTLNPAASSALLGSVTIKFTDITSVTLANQSLIKLVKGTTQISPVSVNLKSGTTNEYVITFDDLSAGNYTLNIGKGAFTYTYTLPDNSNITASVQAISASYTVTQGAEFVYDFTQQNSIYRIGAMNLAAPKDADLNNLILYSKSVAIGVSNKTVTIVNYNTNQTIASGKLQVVSYNESLPSQTEDAVGIVKLVLDSPIASGSLPAAKYAYVIPEGTFGDANFGEYHADPAAFLESGRTKADCHANPYMYFFVDVDNSKQPGEGGGGSETPVVPETPSEAMLAKVKTYLDMTGVGYPTATASARTNLQGAWTSKSVSDDVMQSMLVSYLSTNDIVRPTTGKYYTIAAQSLNGTKAYLTYNNGDVTVTADASKAAVFKATTTGVKTAFATSDGKYLTALTTSGNVLNTYNATVNDLSLNLLPVGNDQLEKSFGLVSLEGIKSDASLMSRVDVNTPAIVTSGNTFTFTDDVTTGFKLTETSSSVVPAPVPVCNLNPASGSSLTSMREIELEITGVSDIKLSDKDRITISDGVQTIKASAVTTVSDGRFKLSFPEVEGGNYTLTVGAGAFTFTFMEQVFDVQEVKATYTLTLYPSEEVVNYASRLLENKGVGYPAADSNSRTALKTLVESGKGSDNKFYDAINAYKAETDIEKPATDKYYHIAGKNNGSLLSYLKYDYLSGTVLMTGNVQDAAVFKATANNDGSTTLALIDGKYLNVLDKDAGSVSATSISLTVSRLVVDSASDNDTYGMVSMSAGGKFSTVDVSSGSISDARTSTVLSGTLTSGFVFTETDEPEAFVPEVSYTILPETNSEDKVEVLENIVLTFETEAVVRLKDESLITLEKLSNNEKYSPRSIEKVKDNVYSIAFINLPATTYRFCVNEGAFVMDFLGKESNIQKIEKYYIVTTAPAINTDYTQINSVKWNEMVDAGKTVKDTYLNTFTLSSSTMMVLNAKADKVKIFKSWNLLTPEATGHLEYASDNTPEAGKVKLVLDKEIKAGDLKDDKYVIVIPKESFGDENYGKYLNDPQSVRWSDCHTNSEIKFEVTVSNKDELNVDFVDKFDVQVAGDAATEEYVSDTFLNDFILTSTAPMATDPTKIVNIYLSWNTFTAKATGHLEVVKSASARAVNSAGDKAYSIKLVLDKEVKEGDLPSDTYSIVIPEGAFGDENYGKYLADPTSISKSECHINSKMTITLKIDNSKATGIGNILLDGDGSEPVYDLNGRRVDTLVPGKVYIKNGKKFVIK